MNISTEYAPTDGMSRSYARSSYHTGRYYAGSGSSPTPSYSGGMDGPHSRRHADHHHSTAPMMLGGFEETAGGSLGSEKPFYAPPPLGSDSYGSPGPDDRHSAYLANYYGGTNYSHQ
uniref:Uncharacterized protein n=1 Tax=Anopheles maculatus TaxID=74869 RepID=A0A182T417_9DIPT